MTVTIDGAGLAPAEIDAVARGGAEVAIGDDPAARFVPDGLAIRGIRMEGRSRRGRER